MVIFTFFRGIVNIPSEGDASYVIFSFSAIVPWTFLTNGISQCAPTIIGNGAILKKIAIPRELFPLVAIVAALFDFIIAGIILFGMMLWFKASFTLSLLWLPILTLQVMILAFGIGMGIAAVGIYRRDFIRGIRFLIQIWFYATPVIYPLSSVPENWLSLYKLNPGVGIIEGFRSVIVFGRSPDIPLLFVSLLGTLIIISITWPLFRIMSQYFADVL